MALGDMEVFIERHVKINQPWAHDTPSSRVPEESRRGLRECGGVAPLLGRFGAGNRRGRAVWAGGRSLVGDTHPGVETEGGRGGGVPGIFAAAARGPCKDPL